MQPIVTLAGMNAKLLRAMLADVPQEMMCRQAGAVRNHAAWQVGHLAFVRSAMAGILGGEAVLGPEWQALCGRGSAPSEDASKYPAKEELMATFERAHRAAMDALVRADDQTLESPTPVRGLAARFPTKRLLMIGMFGTHDGLHLGQLSVWRRVMGLPPVL